MNYELSKTDPTASHPFPLVDITEHAPKAFVPLAPRSFHEIGLTENQVEALVLRFLHAFGAASGYRIAEHLALPFRILEGLLHRMKAEHLVVFRSSAFLHDYVYQLTELGNDRARRSSRHCTYSGPAPVSLEDYIASVRAQSVTKQIPKLENLHKALSDLVLSDEMLGRLGEAINAGQGFFLYGPAGNGKTSIAQRVTRSYGDNVWIPYAICAEGEIIQIFDPSHHEMLPPSASRGVTGDRKIDERWRHIRRPTIVVGGELTMSNLEVTQNPLTGTTEAPLQLKSNCGTLVIDDLGRHRISPAELLNRWITPLESRHDYLNLPNGHKIQVPFDQLIVFSTNLEPRELVDDAFLRRIPYKIEVNDPTEAEFREVFRQVAQEMGIAYEEEAVDYLLDTHYRAAKRPLRNCHPRDLLRQITNACSFYGRPMVVTHQAIDAAVKNYFGIL